MIRVKTQLILPSEALDSTILDLKPNPLSWSFAVSNLPTPPDLARHPAISYGTSVANNETAESWVQGRCRRDGTLGVPSLSLELNSNH